jgi:hypothetical protein
MKPKTKITESDYVNAMRKANRELEIALFGKQVSMCKTRTHKSKKVYDRKKFKQVTITD